MTPLLPVLGVALFFILTLVGVVLVQRRRDAVNAFAAAADKINRIPDHDNSGLLLRQIPLQVDRRTATDGQP